MSELHHEALWASHVFHRHNPGHDAIEEELVRRALELSASATEAVESGVAPTAKEGLFESRFDLLDGPGDVIAGLRGFIVETLVEVVGRVEVDRLRDGATRLDIVESWVHVTEPGGYHDHHFHPFREWCGIYYVRAGGAVSGVNRFYQPFMSMDGNRGHYDVTPEAGWLVVFPGHLAHAALPHGGPDPRIVVAFNARLTTGTPAALPARPDHVWEG